MNQHLVIDLGGPRKIFFDPEKVLLGGGVTRQPRLIGDIQTQYNNIADFLVLVMQFPFKIERCKFGNEANQYGSLYHH